jgi:hypothetical protein
LTEKAVIPGKIPVARAKIRPEAWLSIVEPTKPLPWAHLAEVEG